MSSSGSDVSGGFYSVKKPGVYESEAVSHSFESPVQLQAGDTVGARPGSVVMDE
jgi:hypothetical protein